MRHQKNFARITAALFQAALDVLIFRLSFRLAVIFFMAWRNMHPFSPEANTLFTCTMLAVFYSNSLYAFKTWQLWDEMKAILKSSVLILLVVVLYFYSQGFDFSRFMMSAGTIIFIPLCSMSRYIFRRVLFALGILSTNIIILGAGQTGEIFARKITHHPFTLAHVIGFLDDDKSKRGRKVAGFKVLGAIDDFEKVCERERIDEVAVAISKASRDLLTHILSLVEFRVRQVHYIPDMYMLVTFSSSVRDVGGMPVISASQGLLSPVSRTVKSFADYIVALAGLLITSPMMIYFALKMKRKYGGEIFSRYKCSGLGGKTFMMYKFRSSEDVNSRHPYIDGLPKLFNVLRGEMSIVGPQALTPEYMTRIYGEEAARKISAVKPGITGLWQISLRKDDMRICGEMSIYYIRNWSLWLDIVIIMKTILIAVFRIKP